MTIRIPNWLLIGLGVLLIAGAAFLIGRGTNDDDGGSAETSDQAEPSAETPACSNRQAERLALRGPYSTAIFDVGAVTFPEEILDVYGVRVVACQDLTGDDVDEMVVQASCCTAESPTPWAIFQAEDAQWRPALIRSGAYARLAITPEAVRERTATFTEQDALCCPSGFRRGTVSWDGEEFVYRPDTGTRDRSIAIGADGPESIGGLDLQAANLGQATAQFGVPSSVGGGGDASCNVSWRDLGLQITFANFGGQDPCGSDGRVASLTIDGLEAEQAGWATSDGVRVGMPLEELTQQFPDTRPTKRETYFAAETVGSAFILASRDVPYAAGSTASLVALASQGEVVALYLYVGAAGE